MRVVVIGGGISGLAAAHRLSELLRQKSEIQITLLEAGDRLGGIVQTESRDGFLIEAGPDSFISEKPWALELFKRIGLENEIIPTQEAHRQSFIYVNGRLVPVPRGFYLTAPARLSSLVGTRLLSIHGKIRASLEPLIPRRKKTGDETVASFIRRRLGQEVLERIGQPMIGGIYMANPEELSLQATFPKFLQLEEKYGSVIKGLSAQEKGAAQEARLASGPRYSLFLSLRGGMEQGVKALVARMPDVQVQMLQRVKTIERNKSWKIVLEKGDPIEADAVCLALPAFAAARLLSSTSHEIGTFLKEIDYTSMASIHFAFRESDLRRFPKGFGFVVPSRERKIITACTFSSIKFSGRAPKGFLSMRIFVGSAQVLSWEDRQIETVIRRELAEILNIHAEPVFCLIRRAPDSMPQYRLGHLDRVAAIEKRLKEYPGLFLAGNAYRGIGIPDCIHSGEQAAEGIVKYLGDK